MIIDINLHWYPDNFYSDQEFFKSILRSIPRAYGEHIEVVNKPGTEMKMIKLYHPKGYLNLDAPTEFDVDETLRSMDKAGVDRAILRWPIFPEYVPVDICRRVNDSMAKTVKVHKDRFSGFAIVPPWGDQDCLDELERCVKELGCVGVQVATHYGDLYLDSPEFRPYFKKISELDIPVVVHHTPLPIDYQHIYEHVNLRRMFGRCIDQLTCVGRILYTGLLDEYPNLKFIHTMMAGGLFAFKEIITPVKVKYAGDLERFDPTASDKTRVLMENNIFCDITHSQPWGKVQLECAIKAMGATNVLWGTSYPLKKEWMLEGIDYIRSLEVSSESKDLVLGGNAQRLFKIKS